MSHTSPQRSQIPDISIAAILANLAKCMPRDTPHNPLCCDCIAAHAGRIQGGFHPKRDARPMAADDISNVRPLTDSEETAFLTLTPHELQKLNPMRAI